MNIDPNCRYTESHEWVRKDGNEFVVGISDYAQEELGEIVYVELPMIDDQLEGDEECGMIDSSKASSPLNNPIAGTVTKINELLSDPDQTKLVNESPYDQGWMYALKLKNPADFEKLMDAAQYGEFLEKEQSKH